MGSGLSKEQTALPFGFVKSEAVESQDQEKTQLAIDQANELVKGLELIPSMFNEIQEHYKQEQEFMNQSDVRVVPFSEWTAFYRISACQKSLVRISQNIGLLTQTTRLQLCCNELTEIPAEIGYMRNLQYLSVSKNKLKQLPDTIGLLTKLTDLKASRNQLTTLPPTIKALTQLAVLKLSRNQFKHLPSEVGQLKNLVTLNMSFNPLEYLPAEIARLKFLKHLKLEDVTFLAEYESRAMSQFPSLKELAARVIVRNQIPIWQVSRPEITDYITSSSQCTFCGGPYFDSYVSRKTTVRKLENVEILVEHRLCVDHWKTPEERIALLFCPLPSTAPSPSSSNNGSPSSSRQSSPIMARRVITAATSPMIPFSSLAKSPSLPSLPPTSVRKSLFSKSRSSLSRSRSSTNVRSP